MRPLTILIALGGAGLSVATGLAVDGVLQQRRSQQQALQHQVLVQRLCQTTPATTGSANGPSSPPSVPGAIPASRPGSTVAQSGTGAGASRPRPLNGPMRCNVEPGHLQLSLNLNAEQTALLLQDQQVRHALDLSSAVASTARAPGGASAGSAAPASTSGGRASADAADLAAGTASPALLAEQLGETRTQRLDRVLVGTMIALGLSLSALTALLLELRSLRERRRQASLRTDPQTDLPSLPCLQIDLEELRSSGLMSTASTAMLVTLNMKVLERQRAFLSDAQVGDTLRQLCTTIRSYRPDWTNLRFYRISDHRLAILTRTAPIQPALESKLAFERILHSILNDASEAVVNTLKIALLWDDIVVTGQHLSTPESSIAHLLSNHAFGERLAGEHQLAYRMVEANDEQRGRIDSEISSKLLSLGPQDITFQFQPIILLSDPGRFGLELLMRFRQPVLAKAGTASALLNAHQLGIAHKIDELVIAQLPQLQEWLRSNQEIASKVAYISINISGDSLATPKHLDSLINTLREHEIDNGLFCLEITETAATHQLPGFNHVRTASERLIKELAFRVFIDDFGSGLSNYRRICEAWYDVIKLDIGLIKGISDSFRLQHYVGSFIKSVHALGKTVIAEGVEDANDLYAAVRLGADGLQGFRISKPLNRPALVEYLTSSQWADPQWLESFLNDIRESDKLLSTPLLHDSETTPRRIPLERLLLENWSQLRSYEEFVLLFVNELRLWGLDIMRLSLAFLPEGEDIDCSQYIWNSREPGDVRTLRMEREFLEHQEHRSSPLNRIATTGETMRRRLNQIPEPDFELLHNLKQQGCTDYLGIRLESRGISIPVLTIALQRQSVFSDDQVKRIESMSNLLSLLFYTFESERAKKMALLDSLTGLANRRSFDSFLRANIASVRSSGQPLALAMIDIDRFKAVNDRLGHAYGDKALRKVAAILGGKLEKRSDFLARLGGEEFGLIMSDTDAERAQELCSAMRLAIESAEIDHPEAVSGGVLTISIGIAIWTPSKHEDCDSDSLQQLADDCLYAAKNAGRNRVRLAEFSAPSSMPNTHR